MDFGIEDMDKDPIFKSHDDVTQVLPDPLINVGRQDVKVGSTSAEQSMTTTAGKEKEVAAEKAASTDVGKCLSFWV